MDLESNATGIIEWVNTFGSITRKAETISDFSDGILLWEVLAEIDPQWFKLIRSADVGDNWVLKFNNLKKLYKLITRYYEEILGHSSDLLDAPNLTSIAKDGEINETMKLASLIVALAVQCESNAIYIEKIQSLTQEAQHALMLAIEQVMSKLGDEQAAEKAENPQLIADQQILELEADRARVINEHEELKHNYNELMEDHKQLEYKIEDLTTEKSDLTSRLRDLEQVAARADQTGKADFLMRTEIDNLKQDLERAETQRHEAEMLASQQETLINDLNRKLEDSSKKADEATKLKDQLQEYKHAAEKLQKTENVIEKYKKKLEESTDLRKQVKTLEDQNKQLVERNHHIEEEYRKVSQFKALMDSYKDQIANMESKNNLLVIEKNKLEFEFGKLKEQYDMLELERNSDNEQLQVLEDRLRELELGGGGLGLELNRAHNGDGDSEAPSQGLSEALAESSATELKLKVMRLEREVQAMHQTRNDPGNAQQIILLENLLEDSNRMKTKFEQDYLKAHQQNLILENEVDLLRAASGDDPDRAASDFALTLRMKLNDSEKELSEIKEKSAAAEAKLASIEKELVIAKSDLNLVGKDKLDALAAIREEAGAEINKLQREYDALVIRNRELDAENKKQMLQINELLIEKDSVQTQNIQSKDILLEKERINSELKVTLAALESKNKTGDAEPLKNQLLTESQKNLKLLEEIDKKNNDINMFLAKLKKAKEYIRHQDYKMKMLKEKAETVPKMNYEEALTSLQAELTNRDKEVGRLKAMVNETRVQAKREQQLIISAWYDLARRVQRDVAAPQRNGPTSWLGQQRRTLDIPLKRR